MIQAPLADIVFLLDVDNTLQDNDRFTADLDAQLRSAFDPGQSDRYWKIYKDLQAKVGYGDYLLALQEFRAGVEDDPDLLSMSSFLLDYPFNERLYPHVLETIGYLRTMGPTVVLSAGDVVLQPRKVQRSGIWAAVENRVLIFQFKEKMLGVMQARYPANDKATVLASMKKQLGAKLTTINVKQGHYFAETEMNKVDPKPDASIEHIGDLRNYKRPFFLNS